jgi:hypothetical protein
MSGTIANVLVKPMEVTWGGSALGFTDGDIEIPFSEDLVDVVAHQTGTAIQTAIRTGKNIDVPLVLKETSKAAYEYILKQSGSQATASGGASQVIGWGSAKDFTQVLSQAAKLVFHPVTKASGDKSEDISFWKAYPLPDSFVFSGENPATLSVTFRVFPDAAKADQFKLGVIGDSTSGNFTATT